MDSKVECWSLLCLKLFTGISKGLYWCFNSQLNDIVGCLFLRILQVSMLFTFRFFVILVTKILCFSIWRLLLWSSFCLLELGKLKENILLSCIMSSSLFSSCSQLSCSSCIFLKEPSFDGCYCVENRSSELNYCVEQGPLQTAESVDSARFHKRLCLLCELKVLSLTALI